jgi:prepilin-type N-terminal cleavage/methylation domain-containing protein
MPCCEAGPTRPMPFLRYANSRACLRPLFDEEDRPGCNLHRRLAGGDGQLSLAAVHRRGAFTLIELLLTIAVLGIIAAAIIPSLSADIPARLTSAAQIVSSDLEYARALAVSNNSKYLLTFDTNENFYYLRHSGTNAVLNTLPESPFRHPFDTADTQTTDLTQLPLPAPGVELVAVVRLQSGGQLTTDIEFTPQGATTSIYPTELWLACSRGSTRRFISISVNPLTGLAQIGSLQAELPAAVQSLVPWGASGGAPKAGKTKKGP